LPRYCSIQISMCEFMQGFRKDDLRNYLLISLLFNVGIISGISSSKYGGTWRFGCLFVLLILCVTDTVCYWYFVLLILCVINTFFKFLHKLIGNNYIRIRVCQSSNSIAIWWFICDCSQSWPEGSDDVNNLTRLSTNKFLNILIHRQYKLECRTELK
jgi:hypothetical protein